MAARSAVSRNPLVRGWRRLRSNRMLRMFSGRGKQHAKGAGDAAGPAAVPTDTAASTSPVQSPTAAPLGASSAGLPSAPMVAVAPPQVHDGGSGSRQAAPLQRAPHHAPGPGATRRQRRAARRAARREAPRVSKRDARAAEGELMGSLLQVGRAQWGDAFDTRGLDPRFVPYFDTQRRVLVNVPRPAGGSRRVLGMVEVAGFDPEGQTIVDWDPTEGRVDVRPVFQIRSATLAAPVLVTDQMRIEAAESSNGRFLLLT